LFLSSSSDEKNSGLRAKKMEAARRTQLATYYFDLCESYRLFMFIPHDALALWNGAQNLAPFLHLSPIAVDAACFLVAQKLCDTTAFQIADLADIFGCGETALRAAEKQVFVNLFMQTSLRVDRLLHKALRTTEIHLHEDVHRFFHLSVVGARRHSRRALSLSLSDDACFCSSCTVASTLCVHMRIQASILTARVWHCGKDGTAVESAITDLSNMLLERARDPLGVRFAALARA
jgi:hypothetical protein